MSFRRHSGQRLFEGLPPDPLVALSGAAAAATITIDIQAFIDGRSLLIFQGDTAQWHNLDYQVPGTEGGNNFPTVFDTTLDGVPQWTDYEWYPAWPPGAYGNVWSSVLQPFVPALPATDMTVDLEVLSARYYLTIYQYPSAANGYALILDFNDDPFGGATWYEGRLAITYGVPEPATWLLLASGLLGGLAFLRHRLR